MELRGIRKEFAGVVACDGADLSVRSGAVHALLGENGAGKTSLVNVLGGVYLPDGGEIWVRGVRQQFRSPADAIAAGIGMVHQEFRLVPRLTVAENVVLGAAPRSMSIRIAAEQVARLADAYSLDVEPTRPVWQLSVGERQRVEILKALWRDAEVLVLDEPTAVLTPGEAAELGITLRSMADRGRSVVYISHKLDEVLTVCDEATVLRSGVTVARHASLRGVQRSMLAHSMVGDADAASARVQRRIQRALGDPVLDDVVLGLRGVGALSDQGVPALRAIDLEVRAGEIVGVAGVSGNGQSELAEVIAGLRPVTAGTVRLLGADVGRTSPRARSRCGLAYVPEDRLGVGLAPHMSVVDNTVVRSYRSMRRGIMLDRRRCEEFCAGLVDRYGVRAGHLHADVGVLSGGNLQRLLLGRELAGDPKVLVAAQPTRGLDVAGIAAIQEQLLTQRSAGVGVLLICEDLDELLALSDRLVVMYEGRIIARVDPRTTTRVEVGAAMAGGAAARDRREDCGARRVGHRSSREPRTAGQAGSSPRTVSRSDARRRASLIRPMLQRRARVLPAAQACAFAIGIAAALVAGALLLLAAGNDPAQVYDRMFDASLGGIDSVSRTLVRATPLAIAGLAVATAGSMGLWNIGAEGQMTAGATFAAGLAMTAGDLPGPLLILAMIGAGAVGGVVLMAGPALARAYLGVSEIITTLMLVEVSIRLVEWLQTGPWKDPASQGFALIEPLPEQASLPTMFGRAHIGAVIAVGLLVTSWLAVSRTAWGYELRLAGASPATARYAGISMQRKVLAVLVLSGAVAGLAGAVELTGTATRLDPGLANGYGFAGIIVAALALMRPSGVAAVAFVFGAVQVGGQSIQTLGVTSSVATMLQAMILIGALVAAVLLNYRVRWVRPVGHGADADSPLPAEASRSDAGSSSSPSSAAPRAPGD
ncbi:ATP-binding cassette domain-containing protein [Candidatus Poriferisodalis sp.]|uniref:ATP-binding cassette domain-containing protein n=1 Tax=Candidatus Poriferisodalis sp. TaxID=3101277 RepID=UPI003B015BEC